MSGRDERAAVERVLDAVVDVLIDRTYDEHAADRDIWMETIDHLRLEIAARVAEARAEAVRETGERIAAARDEGIRQAIEWLRADYEYGTGPEWRENGAEWIAECAAEDRRARALIADAEGES